MSTGRADGRAEGRAEGRAADDGDDDDDDGRAPRAGEARWLRRAESLEARVAPSSDGPRADGRAEGRVAAPRTDGRPAVVACATSHEPLLFRLIG